MPTRTLKAGVRARRWTKAEFYRLGELGFFDGQKVELIEGKLMVHSPQKSLHAGTIEDVNATLLDLFGLGYRVRVQLPLDLGQTTEPEPDLAVVTAVRRRHRAAHPTSALLIVEVSETTLAYDRGEKAGLYAAAGIADYWVVNLVDKVVEVYRDPVADPSQPHGARYASHVSLAPPASVAPLAAPGKAVDVAELLP